MSNRDAKLLLIDISEACEKIFRFTENMSYNEFSYDDKTSDAVIRNLEVIGEAANHLPESFISSHPEIGWSKAIAVRNRIIHEYFGVDYSILWQIIHNYLPDFYKSVQQIIKEIKLP
jgi:uncharacterized protein with HEPN domain